jgi:hypothetical protein
VEVVFEIAEVPAEALELIVFWQVTVLEGLILGEVEPAFTCTLSSV